MATITFRLRDAHTALIGEISGGQFDGQRVGAGFDIYEGYPPAFDSTILFNNYIQPANMTVLAGEEEEADRLIYGHLNQAEDLGYIYLPSFNVSISEQELESLFNSLQETKGLIFDVRGNKGGDPALATTIASYFMDQTTYTGFERFKVGPGPADFADSPSFVTPATSDHRYLQPVAVLTDRGVYSATTTLAYCMSPLDQVIFIGQRSGGGSGSVADGYLANGWYWSLSVSEFFDYEGRHLDDGVEPDIAVSLNLGDTTKDEILERAILELQ
jgi:C-terminal processing protease CtpA/Prc